MGCHTLQCGAAEMMTISQPWKHIHLMWEINYENGNFKFSKNVLSFGS
jgi:hypothetical protein